MTAPRPDLAVVELRDWLEHGFGPAHPWTMALDDILAERAALMAENKRFREMLCTDGLTDPELVKIAGKPMSLLDAIVAPECKFDPAALMQRAMPTVLSRKIGAL